jgi:hypothetical protein
VVVAGRSAIRVTLSANVRKILGFGGESAGRPAESGETDKRPKWTAIAL